MGDDGIKPRVECCGVEFWLDAGLLRWNALGQNDPQAFIRFGRSGPVWLAAWPWAELAIGMGNGNIYSGTFEPDRVGETLVVRPLFAVR